MIYCWMTEHEVNTSSLKSLNFQDGNMEAYFALTLPAIRNLNGVDFYFSVFLNFESMVILYKFSPKWTHIL